MELELDYFQLPRDEVFGDEDDPEEEKLGDKLATISLDAAKTKVEGILNKLLEHIYQELHRAAAIGSQSLSIEFKAESQHEFYAFLSNFSHRELLLHHLLTQNLDVQFNDISSGQGHSYILFITLWNRYTRKKTGSSLNRMMNKLLEQLNQGVEVKTSKDEHILSISSL